MNVTTAIMLMAVTAMGAFIAHLKRQKTIAIGLVILLGVLLGNSPGTPGEWAESSAHWLFELPGAITEMVEG